MGGRRPGRLSTSEIREEKEASVIYFPITLHASHINNSLLDNVAKHERLTQKRGGRATAKKATKDTSEPLKVHVS